MQKKRDARYDYAKLFLISCVVMGHLGNRYADDSATVASIQFWVYLFHMPAFIFISGLFAKRTVREKQWTKAAGYVLLYIFFKFLNYLVTGINKGFDSASINFFRENGIPWFALAMFWWFMITILIQKADKRVVFAGAILAAVASGYFKQINSFLVIQRTINFYPFFYAGYAMDLKKLGERLTKTWVRVVSVALLAVSAFISFAYYDKIYYWRGLFRGLKAYSAIKKGMPYEWGGLWRLLAFVISFALAFAVLSVMPSIETFISRLGRQTLSVYVFHSACIALSLKHIPGLSKWMRGGRLAVRCVILLVVIVLFTSLPIFEWPLRKLMELPEMVRKKLAKKE